MNILVTGGAGYIGSHAVQRLLRDGHTVVAIDDLSLGHREAIDALTDHAGDRLVFEKASVGETTRLETLMGDHDIDTVFHFAAFASVGESVAEPLRYYRNNIAEGIGLLEACNHAGVGRFVFSSSCATYGEPADEHIPIRENCPKNPVSPYGQTKLDFERILEAWAEARRNADEPVAVTMLRYFNVAGCDRTGILGEDHDPETHLIPVALEAALGKRDGMAIFGTDYPTPDGTAVRDYVHVEDLIDAHVRAMEHMQRNGASTPKAYNIGIGNGHSVREVIDSVRRVSSVDFPVRDEPRRSGDPARLYADSNLVTRDLGWKAQITDLDAIVDSAWQWMQRHPNGYEAT